MMEAFVIQNTERQTLDRRGDERSEESVNKITKTFKYKRVHVRCLLFGP